MSEERVDILILGAGPAGLGAAWRLAELGRSDWLCLERDDGPGGLSRSFVDSGGFTWDLGGHIIFSRLEPFNRMLGEALPEGCLEHERRAFVRLAGRDVPYPFQNNLHHLPESVRRECIEGLESAASAADAGSAPPANFAEWAERSFGAGICKHFMRPYNRKLWCRELEELSAGWVGERVSLPEPGKVLESARLGRDDASWGPNRTFRFPRSGGTGAIWRALAARLPAGRVRYGSAAVGLDLARRRVRLSGGGSIGYGHLISTLPLDELCRMSEAEDLIAPAGELRHTTVDVFGFGMAGRPPAAVADKCWMYFPNHLVPFFRMTVFSNYSPANVPDPAGQWSLMLEVASLPERAAAREAEWLRIKVLDWLQAEGCVTPGARVVSDWHRRADYAYPVPTVARDAALGEIVPKLEARGVLPRGRFGAWRYELGNMDHCFVQGVEAVGRIVEGRAETLLGGVKGGG